MNGWLSLLKISDTEFHWLEDGQKCGHVFSRLGMLIDAENGILFKIGEYDLVEKSFNEMVSKLSMGNAMCKDMIDDLAIVDISLLDNEEIQKIMNICDYCKKIHGLMLNNLFKK